MKLEEIKSAIEELSADDSATFMTEYLSAERVKSFMDTDAGQKIMQPYFDKRVTSSIETWKGNYPKICKLKEMELVLYPRLV